VTIYQPTSQWVFAGITKLHDALPGKPDRGWALHDKVLAFKTAFALLDLILIGLIIYQLIRLGRNIWWAAMYAWHPLALIEISQSGHQDVIGLLLLFAGLALWCTGKTHGGKIFLSGVLFAMAVAVKPVIVPVLLPLAVDAYRKRIGLRRVAMFDLGMVLALLALYLPFALMPGGLGGMIETIRTFMGQWAFNSPIHVPLTQLLGSKTAASAITGFTLLAVLLFASIRFDLWRAVMIYFFAALLLSSTVYPWYLLWALVFLPLRWHGALAVWSVTIFFSYAVWFEPTAWRVPMWAMAVQYLPVAMMLAWQMIHTTNQRDADI